MRLLRECLLLQGRSNIKPTQIIATRLLRACWPLKELPRSCMPLLSATLLRAETWGLGSLDA